MENKEIKSQKKYLKDDVISVIYILIIIAILVTICIMIISVVSNTNKQNNIEESYYSSSTLNYINEPIIQNTQTNKENTII